MGSAAVDVLLRLARDKGKQIPEHRRLGVELIERQSCMEPRAGLLRASQRA
jgi:DNA-binding LacI/PurR family transcriptional regulator